ncbi:glycosyltransferase family 2 protein [Leeuwenhoekiella parthenopeia]|uniref:Glycosyltransferase family 2 protein n=1 Tax=Leeuwenhoekiella parthenopeia TaxID=2890320 RepID=A0ABS8GWT5_9FLAO|nr:glycosyltransferase family 2 protein [Leeuwenhoekiella parthenopeia]MCC4214248.1 glycosyltransferase family 2 protein [Leeuwenhoekiella parthenopeia]
MKRIAALITCFNRVEKTIDCIGRLQSIDSKIDVYLVDDGSTDGTSEKVNQAFPKVSVIRGNGNLYWNRGMHLAWKMALINKVKYDYFLWLNDDVNLFDFSIEELLNCANRSSCKAVISGLIVNETGDRVIYGGMDANKMPIQPNGEMQKITNLNGNVVLVPRGVYQEIGILDPYYHHDLGDVDYGLRAQKSGFAVLTTTRGIGQGFSNDISRMRLNNASFVKRYKYLYSPLGANPRINFYYRKRYKGILNAVVYFIFLHFLNFIPDSVNKFLFGTKYQ